MPCRGFFFTASETVYYHHHVGCCTSLFVFVFLLFVWCPCMAINVSVQYNGGHYTVDPMLPASGNPFKCYEVLYLQSRFPGDNGSSDRCLFRTGALLGSALDPSKWLMFCPTVLQAGSWNRSCATPGSSLARLMFWWRTRRAPSAGGSFHTGAFSQRTRSVPRPVVLTYQRSSLGGVERIAVVLCSLAGSVGFPLTPG